MLLTSILYKPNGLKAASVLSKFVLYSAINITYF